MRTRIQQRAAQFELPDFPSKTNGHDPFGHFVSYCFHISLNLAGLGVLPVELLSSESYILSLRMEKWK